jgi:adenylyltransferase/sulfurtransferase
LLYLTAAGIGTIGIVDFDIVDESNLQRQVLYTTEDIGKTKTSIAEEKLSKLNPHVSFNLYKTKLDQANAEDIIKEYDLVIDCPDNFSTRYIVSDACKNLNKPHVFGSVCEFEGQLSVFNYKNGPIYSNLFPESYSSERIAENSQTGIIGVLPGIIGCMQANEAIKIITGAGEVLSGKLFIIDILNNNFNILNI